MGSSKLSLAVVVAASMLLASDAHAGWGHWGGSYGGHASYGCVGASYGCVGASVGDQYGSYGYASSGYWVGRPWLGARLRAHWAAHRARKLARHAYYASGGCWGGCHGSYASSGCWGGGYASTGWSGGCVGGCVGSSAGTWVDDCATCESGSMSTVPMEQGTIESEPATDDAAGEEDAAGTSILRTSDRGILTVQVPSDAQVFVNDSPTRSMGAERRYVSNGLSRGYSYRYEVRAIVERDGQPQELTRVATLRAGQSARLSFDFDQPQSVETRLTLHVPQNAKVSLSGNATRATGPVRQFATTRIPQGEQWADYLVEVSVEREGRTLTKQERIRLNGGDQKELVFDFDQPERVAAR